MIKYVVIFAVCLVIFYGILAAERYFTQKKDKKDTNKITIKDCINRVLVPSIIVTTMFLFLDGTTLPSWMGGEVEEPILQGDYFENRGGPMVNDE